MVRPITFTLAAAALMLSAMSLSGCATALDGATEDIRIDIAGTGEALCDVTQPGRRYRAYAPSTFRVMKSGDPLKIRCSAPGNRQQIVTVDAIKNPHADYNVATLGAGYAWDYATGAIHEYPKRILIDFSEMPGRPYPLPDYQLVFQRHPELTGIEQFNPGVAVLQSDLGKGSPTLTLRDENDSGPSEIMMPPPGVTPGAQASPSATKPLPPVTMPQTATPTILAPSASVAKPGVTGASATTPGAAATESGKTSSMKIFNNKIGTTPSTTGN